MRKPLSISFAILPFISCLTACNLFYYYDPGLSTSITESKFRKIFIRKYDTNNSHFLINKDTLAIDEVWLERRWTKGHLTWTTSIDSANAYQLIISTKTRARERFGYIFKSTLKPVDETGHFVTPTELIFYLDNKSHIFNLTSDSVLIHYYKDGQETEALSRKTLVFIDHKD